jgi:hypothetical protein
MTMFETRMPRNRASRHESKVTVKTPNTNRIAFGIVNVLARTMLAYERLVGGAGSGPRSRNRRAASS